MRTDAGLSSLRNPFRPSRTGVAAVRLREVQRVAALLPQLRVLRPEEQERVRGAAGRADPGQDTVELLRALPPLEEDRYATAWRRVVAGGRSLREAVPEVASGALSAPKASAVTKLVVFAGRFPG